MPPYTAPPYPGLSSGTAEDFFTGIKNANQSRINQLLKIDGGKRLTASQFARDAAATTFNNLRSGGGYNLPIGFANLAEILGSQGRTDPGRLNYQLADISRGAQGNQDRIREEMARLGLSSSGLNPALQGAAGQAGVNQRSQAIASENALAEERRRGDLGLLYDLIIGPSIQGYGIERGVSTAQAAQRQQQNAANQQFIATLLGTAGTLAACWVAREVYGDDNPRWLEFREWMLEEAPEDLRSLYLERGEEAANMLRERPHLKPRFRDLMDRILEGRHASTAA